MLYKGVIKLFANFSKVAFISCSLFGSSCFGASCCNIYSESGCSCCATCACDNYDKCLVLKSLHLSSPGDLDRVNEEVELEVKSGESGTGTYENNLDCGLILLNTTSGKDRNLNIPVKCKSGEYVLVRFYERDRCNDDMVLVSIKCLDTDGTQNLAVSLSPDYTATSCSQCKSKDVTLETCAEATAGVRVVSVGGSTCVAYSWGKEECGSVEEAETESEYNLQYRIDGTPCGGTNTELCRNGNYEAGEVCKIGENSACYTTTSSASFLQPWTLPKWLRSLL